LGSSFDGMKWSAYKGVEVGAEQGDVYRTPNHGHRMRSSILQPDVRDLSHFRLRKVPKEFVASLATRASGCSFEQPISTFSATHRFNRIRLIYRGQAEEYRLQVQLNIA
jgi:hypothetical protein